MNRTNQPVARQASMKQATPVAKHETNQISGESTMNRTHEKAGRVRNKVVLAVVAMAVVLTGCTNSMMERMFVRDMVDFTESLNKQGWMNYYEADETHLVLDNQAGSCDGQAWKHREKQEFVQVDWVVINEGNPSVKCDMYGIYVHHHWETQPQEITVASTGEIGRCGVIERILPAGVSVSDNRTFENWFEMPKLSNEKELAKSLFPPEGGGYRPENPYRPGQRVCVRRLRVAENTGFSAFQVKEKELEITVKQSDYKSRGEPPTPDWKAVESVIRHIMLAYGEDLGYRYAVVEQVADRSTASANPDEISTTGGSAGTGYGTTYMGIDFTSANTSLKTTTSTRKQGGSFSLETKHRIRYQETEPEQDNYIDLEFLKRNAEFAYKYTVKR